MLPEEAATTAQLMELIDGAFEADEWLTHTELGEGGWLFYVLVVDFESEDGVIAFVRKYNPQRGLESGRLQVAARGNTLTRFTKPLFNFDFRFDVIIAPDEIAILSVTAFNSVFADVEIAQLHVEEHVKTVTDGLAVTLAKSSRERLLSVCGDKKSFANRLRRLAHANHLDKVTKAALAQALERHGMPAERLGKAKIRLGNNEDVGVFFDLVEGLYYEADFTDEPRRSDRFSVRKA